MIAFFDTLREFLPLWLALIAIGFVYLIYLYTKFFRTIKDLAEQRVQSAEQHAEQRVQLAEQRVQSAEQHAEKCVQSAMDQVQFFKDRCEKLPKFDEAISIFEKLSEFHKIEDEKSKRTIEEMKVLYQPQVVKKNQTTRIEQKNQKVKARNRKS